MIFVGIDVAKDKHDCFILNSEGTVLADVFTIANNRIGFETLLSRIQSCSQGESKIKVGLEATGHYSYNLLGFLLDSGLTTYVINPLHTNLSYYKVVVIKFPLQGQNATIDKVLWIGLNLLPQDGFRKAPTTALCF